MIEIILIFCCWFYISKKWFRYSSLFLFLKKSLVNSELFPNAALHFKNPLFYWSRRKGAYLKRTRSWKMSCNLFALIEWDDRYLSIISLDTICQPRKEITIWRGGGGYIKTKFRGSIYSAVIADISGKSQNGIRYLW